MNVAFGDKSLNQMFSMDACGIMMEQPSICCPQIRSFAPHSITMMMKDLLVVLLYDGLALWYVLKFPHGTRVKENGQHDLEYSEDLSVSGSI